MIHHIFTRLQQDGQVARGHHDLFSISGTVTAIRQSAFTNDLTIIAYLEITEASGRLVSIEKAPSATTSWPAWNSGRPANLRRPDIPFLAKLSMSTVRYQDRRRRRARPQGSSQANDRGAADLGARADADFRHRTRAGGTESAEGADIGHLGPASPFYGRIRPKRSGCHGSRPSGYGAAHRVACETGLGIRKKLDGCLVASSRR